MPSPPITMPPSADDDGAQPLLVGCEFVCANTAPTAGYDPSFEAPAWLDELTPEQRAVVSARESGEVMGTLEPHWSSRATLEL